MTSRMRITVVVCEGSGHPLEDPVGGGGSYLHQEALVRMQDSILEASKDRTSY